MAHGPVDRAFTGLAENVEMMIRECDEAVSAKSQLVGAVSQLVSYDSNLLIGASPSFKVDEQL